MNKLNTLIEQLKFFKEELKKTPQDPRGMAQQPPKPTFAEPSPSPKLNINLAEKPSQNLPAPTLNPHSQKIKDLYEKMSTAHAAGKSDEVNTHKGELKQHLLDIPKGEVDIGLLNKLRESSPKINGRRAFAHSDMEDAINHHFSDIKSIKDIYNTHGLDGVEALMRTMGANGDPIEYSGLKLRSNVYHDLLDLVNPAKSAQARKETGKRRDGVSPRTYLHGIEPDDPKYQQDVVNTWNAMREENEDGSMGYDNPSISKAHEDAVVRRGLHLFKKKHKLQ